MTELIENRVGRGKGLYQKEDEIVQIIETVYFT
jgi:hypothetical protein